MMKYPIFSASFIMMLSACGGGGGGTSLDQNTPTPTPIPSCQASPTSLNDTPCDGAEMTLQIITVTSPKDVSENTNTVVLSDLNMQRNGLFQGYSYVVGLTGNTNETMAYAPMSGTLPAQTLTYERAAHVETVNPANQSHAYSLKMDATVEIDLTQTTPDMDVVLQNGTDHSALSGNATVPVTGDERVSINNLTIDPTTGRFSTTATSTITQRNFVAGGIVKTYTNPTLAGGLAVWRFGGSERV
jgi:hypothetical protein